MYFVIPVNLDSLDASISYYTALSTEFHTAFQETPPLFFSGLLSCNSRALYAGTVVGNIKQLEVKLF